ncbi:MAG: potassium transporter Kup [Neisseriales bacterium]|nr:MAG: potassium transporter Kup [Neisseriales bacterium]
MSTEFAIRNQSLTGITLAALGVVYGDIGTSPLYAVKECFLAEGLSAEPFNVLGFISLIFWAIMLVVCFKYVLFILKADSHQEGGIMVLMALARKRLRLSARWVVILLGLMGTALFYGDSAITPAISVLSASEGLQIVNVALAPYVLPMAIVILLVLFLIQRFGTARVGICFGPIMFIWFLTLAILGLLNIWQMPSILFALNPWHGIHFIWTYGSHSLLGLGAVVLALTGAEALYADMGHFGRRPIQYAWFSLVLPSLVLNYLGQGALLLRHPEALAESPFFLLAPNWALLPLVCLATIATVIASQSVISGAYSLTRQAIQLGFCPRMQIRHTSVQEMGQIYLPFINWVLLAIVLVIVLDFRSSSHLAAAYGIAVTGTMLTSTLLFFVVMHRHWHWPIFVAGGLTGLFLAIDLVFFSANIFKIMHGGWLPLVIGALIFTLMSTWWRGRRILSQRIQEQALPLQAFIKEVEISTPQRVQGTAIFLDRTAKGVPHALLHNLKHNKVLHERVVIMTIKTEDVPFIGSAERVEVSSLSPTFSRVVARYGFKETPNIPSIITACAERGLSFYLMETSFFLSKEALISTSRPGMAPWRERLFIWMSKNALRPTDFFQIPLDRVVELGAQVEL